MGEQRPKQDSMAEAVENMLQHRVRSTSVDRSGWTDDQWIEDAARLMGDLEGSVQSLVNGHVLALLRAADRTLPDPKGGCACTGHEEKHDYATEYLLEYNPACPEHSTHVYNPRTGVWEQRLAPLPPEIEARMADGESVMLRTVAHNDGQTEWELIEDIFTGVTHAGPNEPMCTATMEREGSSIRCTKEFGHGRFVYAYWDSGSGGPEYRDHSNHLVGVFWNEEKVDDE